MLKEKQPKADLLLRYEKIQRILSPERFIFNEGSHINMGIEKNVEPIIEEKEEDEGEILTEEQEEAIQKNKELFTLKRKSSVLEGTSSALLTPRRSKKLDILEICRLINEKNTSYAGIYLNNIPRLSLIEIFDAIFKKKLSGDAGETRASLGGLFFKEVKTFVRNSSDEV